MEIETPGSNSKDSLELNLDKSVDIVGTKHKNVQPSQDVIDPETVDYYYEKISNGEVVDPISIKIVFDQGKYIADGHNRYVAYKKLGYDYADIPKVEEYVDSYNGFDDWSKVKYVSGAKGD